MCEDCKRIAAAVENIELDMLIVNGLLARLSDHLGLPSPDGNSRFGRFLKDQAGRLEFADTAEEAPDVRSAASD